MRGLRARFAQNDYLISSEDDHRAPEQRKSINIGLIKQPIMKFPPVDNTEAGLCTVLNAVEYEMVRKGRKKSTRNFVLSKIKTLMRWGVSTPSEEAWVRLYLAHENQWAPDTARLYWWSMNVWAQSVGMPEIPKPRFHGRRGVRTPVSADELRAMLNAAKDNIMTYTIIMLMAYTGMRNGEIRALRADSVDFKNNVIHVLDGGYGQGTKNGEAADVPMFPELREILEKYIAVREKFMRENGIVNHFLFFCEQHDQLGWWYLNQLVDRLAKKAGIERRIFPHLFRHALCDNLRRAGWGESEIMVVSRHKSVASLHNYLHPTLKETAERMKTTKLYE